MLISIIDYAKKHGKDVSTIRRLCLNGKLPTAKKLSRICVIEENTPYPDDHRIKSGKYSGMHTKRKAR